jgi:hypothetical protein
LETVDTPSNRTTTFPLALDAQPTPVPLRVPDEFYDTPLRVRVESLLKCPNCDEAAMTAGSGCFECGTSDSTSS